MSSSVRIAITKYNCLSLPYYGIDNTLPDLVLAGYMRETEFLQFCHQADKFLRQVNHIRTAITAFLISSGIAFLLALISIPTTSITVPMAYFLVPGIAFFIASIDSRITFFAIYNKEGIWKHESVVLCTVFAPHKRILGEFQDQISFVRWSFAHA